MTSDHNLALLVALDVSGVVFNSLRGVLLAQELALSLGSGGPNGALVEEDVLGSGSDVVLSIEPFLDNSSGDRSAEGKFELEVLDGLNSHLRVVAGDLNVVKGITNSDMRVVEGDLDSLSGLELH